ncbi:MAG: hypothetical protein H0X51_01055 [Parachlamydiaceae bacterium]|nr:hypothetical protein [Parachlamydiaceae bacterium]
MKHWISLSLILATVAFGKSSVYAEGCGRLDIGPAFARVDILTSNKTTTRLNMLAVRGDATIMLLEGSGLCLKPTAIYGKAKHGEIVSAGLGLGYYVPVYECLGVTPYVGCTYTHLQAEVDVPLPIGIELHGVKETFRSLSPFIAVDITYRFNETWRIYGTIQYCFSRTHTDLKLKAPELGLDQTEKFKSDAKGPNYALVLEHDLNKCWSISLGAAYNISLSKEKHGLRAAGAKIGVVYWF